MSRILVVDDDSALVALLGEVFGEEGWEVTAAPTSLNVPAALDGQRPDLIIVDIRLETPDGGWKLIEWLQSRPVSADIPILVCSAAARSLAARQDWLRERHITALPKPFDLEDLLGAVRRLVNAPTRARSSV